MMNWESYRRTHLTPNNWRASGSPGVYVHQETGNELHVWAYLSELGKQIWQVYAERGEAPDPNETHIERRHRLRGGNEDGRQTII